MAAAQCRRSDRPASYLAFGDIQRKGFDVACRNQRGFHAGRIQFGGVDAARRYTVGGNGAGSNLTGGNAPGINTCRGDFCQFGIGVTTQSGGYGINRGCPLKGNGSGESNISGSVPRDIAARHRTGSRRFKTPLIATDTCCPDSHRSGCCRIGVGSILLRTAIDAVTVDTPSSDGSLGGREGQGIDVSGGDERGFQGNYIDTQS